MLYEVITNIQSMKPNFKNIDLKSAQKQQDAARWEQENHISRDWMTAEQIPVKQVYSKEDLDGMEHLNYAAGVAPYLRGPYSTMYVMRPWTIRQYAGFSTAEESNAFYRRNLAAGQKGVITSYSIHYTKLYDSWSES